MNKWISVIREDSKEIKFKTDEISRVKFGSDDIHVYLANKGCEGCAGWRDSLYFGLPTDSVKNAEAGNFWDWEVVTREELEKLRIKLQEITKEEKINE